jgi:secreted trypsin-like serine protease
MVAFFLGVASTASSQGGSAPLKRAVAAAERGDRGLRIVGGEPVPIVKHPWQVALLADAVADNAKAQFCGGSMIADRWVVTAAHCVDGGTTASQVNVLSGSSSLACGSRIKVTRIVVHQSWNPGTQDFDIALLEVAKDLSGLPIKGLTAANEAAHLVADASVTVSGWGTLAFGDSSGTTQLQAVSVPFVARDTCNKPVSYNGKITENMLCAGRATGGADSCQGDSGGPATTAASNDRRLAGIVSWGEGCAAPLKFGVYTRVARFSDWVKEKTGNAVSW